MFMDWDLSTCSVGRAPIQASTFFPQKSMIGEVLPYLFLTASLLLLQQVFPTILARYEAAASELDSRNTLPQEDSENDADNRSRRYKAGHDVVGQCHFC